MQLERLDHVNVRTANLAAMVAWYERVLGMRSGARPPFPFPGAWLYIGDHACVHLVGVAKPQEGREPRLEQGRFRLRADPLRALLREEEEQPEAAEHEERPAAHAKKSAEVIHVSRPRSRSDARGPSRVLARLSGSIADGDGAVAATFHADRARLEHQHGAHRRRRGPHARSRSGHAACPAADAPGEG